MTNILSDRRLSTTLMEEMDATSYVMISDNSTIETATHDRFLKDTETYLSHKVAKYIQIYWLPILIPLGLVGNTLSFLVMMKPNNRKISTCIYMTAISINDNVMMCIEIRAWLIDTVKMQRVNDWECYSLVYLELLLLQYGTYLVLGMTIDKYIAIKWPHRAAAYSTPRRAKAIIFTIIITGAVYNLPHFFLTIVTAGDVTAGNCYAYSVKGIFTKIYSWFTIVLNAIIPFTVLIHMNYVIVKTVKNSGKMFRSDVTRTETRQKTMKSAENQLTTMLLLVTTLFLILLLPTYIRYVYSAFMISDTPYKYATYILFSKISYKLYVTNSGVNFFLYCVSGQKFRNDLKDIVCSIGRSSPSTVESNVDTNISDI